MKKIDKKKIILITIISVIIISLITCFIIAYIRHINTNNKTANSISTKYNNIDYGTNKKLKGTTITSKGSYDIEGEYSCITINTDEDVKLNLNNATITCTSAPAIYVENAKTVNIELNGENTITAETTEQLDGAIYSKDDLVFTGDGSIEINSNYDGIVSKDTLLIKSGNYTINAKDDGIRGKDNVVIMDGEFNIKAGGDGIKSTNETDDELGYIIIENATFNIDSSDDGIHSNTDITINSGNITITSGDDAIHADGMLLIESATLNLSAREGLEATYVKINGGSIKIDASDDGINAGNKSDKYQVTIEINGGEITINMGQGDTDGIDSNGNLYINGGTINITAQSPFDYDGEAKYNGGTIIVNGQTTNTITNQMMNGGPMDGDPRGQTRRGMR